MQPKTIFPQSDVLEYAMAEASVYGSSTYELSTNDRLFPETIYSQDNISNTKLGKGDHYYIQTRHKDIFSHYNLILRKL